MKAKPKRRTLVIGIGGTGCRVLSWVKHGFYPDGIDKDAPNWIRFVAIDLDEISGTNKEGAEILDDFLLLDTLKVKDKVRYIDRAENEAYHSWYGDPEGKYIQLREAIDGAGQWRPLGRLAYLENQSAIENRIREALDDLRKMEFSYDELTDSVIEIFLISSVAGGTGGGLLIDTAYYLQSLTTLKDVALRIETFAFILLPDVFEKFDGGKRVASNSYAALKELKRFYLGEQDFRVFYPQRSRDFIVPAGKANPFTSIYLLDPKLDNREITDPRETYQYIGNLLYLKSVSDLGRQARSSFANRPVPPLIKGKEGTLSKEGFVFSTCSGAIIEFPTPEDAALYAAVILCEKVFPEVLENDIHRNNRDSTDDARSISESNVDECNETWKLFLKEYDDRLSKDGLVHSILKKEDSGMVLEDQFWSKVLGKTIEEGAHREAEAIRSWFNQEYKKDLFQDPKDKSSAFAAIKRYKLRLEEIGNALDPTKGKASKGLESMGLSSHTKIKENLSNLKIPWYDKLYLVLFPRTYKVIREKQEKQKQNGDIKVRAINDAPGPFREKFKENVKKILEQDESLKNMGKMINQLHDRYNYFVNHSTPFFKKRITEKRINIGGGEEEGSPLNRWEVSISALEKSVQKNIGKEIGTFERMIFEEIFEEEFEGIKKLGALKELAFSEEIDIGKIHSRIVAHLKEGLITGRFKLDLEKFLPVIEGVIRNAKSQVFTNLKNNPVEYSIVFWSLPRSDSRFSYPIPLDMKGVFEEMINREISKVFPSCKIQRMETDQSDENLALTIYYESHHHPSENIRGVLHMRDEYNSFSYPKSLLHINKNYAIWPGLISDGLKDVYCGNPGCEFNISDIPREVKVCPECENAILNRCGNPRCPEDNLLHKLGGWGSLDRTKVVCPECNDRISTFWWECDLHSFQWRDRDERFCKDCQSEAQQGILPYLNRREKPEEFQYGAFCVNCKRSDKIKDPFMIPAPLLYFSVPAEKEPFLKHLVMENNITRNQCPTCTSQLFPVCPDNKVSGTLHYVEVNHQDHLACRHFNLHKGRKVKIFKCYSCHFPLSGNHHRCPRCKSDTVFCRSCSEDNKYLITKEDLVNGNHCPMCNNEIF